MASTYAMVAYGSQGSAVKQLQSELNRRGYSLDEDGIFGKKTRAAVRDYQKKNGLRMVDGIAGDETWGSLLASPTAEEQAALDAAKNGIFLELCGVAQRLRRQPDHARR